MAAPASRARQANFSRSRICPLGGLVLRTHSGVSDDGYGPIHAEGLADRFAAEEPPFPKLSLVRRNFQALRWATTARLMISGKTWPPEASLGGASAGVLSAGTFKPIKLLVFVRTTRQSGPSEERKRPGNRLFA